MNWVARCLGKRNGFFKRTPFNLGEFVEPQFQRSTRFFHRDGAFPRNPAPVFGDGGEKFHARHKDHINAFKGADVNIAIPWWKIE
jgi:hypothetical protein